SKEESSLPREPFGGDQSSALGSKPRRFITEWFSAARGPNGTGPRLPARRYFGCDDSPERPLRASHLVQAARCHDQPGTGNDERGQGGPSSRVAYPLRRRDDLGTDQAARGSRQSCLDRCAAESSL